jgi:hypothetical protein
MSKGRGSGFISSQYRRWSGEPPHFTKTQRIHKQPLSEAQSPEETTASASGAVEPSECQCDPLDR